MKTILLLIALFLFAAEINAASFDCSKATNSVEDTICANQWLGSLDEELAYYYSKLRDKLSPDAAADLLNEQRRWLKKREERCGSATCLGDMYSKRVTQLKIMYEEPLLPSNKVLNNICSAIASLDAKDRNNYGSNEGINDINNDGIDEKPIKCHTGTMRVPCIDYILPNGDKFKIQKVNFEWKTYWTYGLRHFKKDGLVYRFHSYDDYFEKPAYLSIVTPKNNEYVVCEFENKIVEQLIPQQQNKKTSDLCSLVQSRDDNQILYITLPDKPSISYVDLRNMGRYETSLARQGFVDYDNDGIPNYIGELEYASGAGRGCDFNYFDEFADSKRSFS